MRINDDNAVAHFWSKNFWWLWN